MLQKKIFDKIIDLKNDFSSMSSLVQNDFNRLLEDGLIDNNQINSDLEELKKELLIAEGKITEIKTNLTNLYKKI